MEKMTQNHDDIPSFCSLWLRQNKLEAIVCGYLQNQQWNPYDLGSAAYAPFDSN